MLQILHAIFRDPTDTTTRIKLLYANQTPDDILVREELEQLQANFPDRFSLWYTVDRVVVENKEWTYSTGFITPDMVAQHVAFETSCHDQTQFFLCGPPPMIQYACVPALESLGFTNQHWVVF
jgi:NAD(P)H-flavin reductase